ncbi:prolipoprotein diacylglyceryl transferase [Schaalia sp. Marseille-Q2122]|uniref:prolipoprotein diacylglyceryl transferase n=1 Tax=Schaalia sp. Marseille-Q2122 TaxID=2736604 RepID=UPI00158835F6|nr:prolipoprotein diacylglyceryl transferase [Schaalia sp. Marseille-Q2122]
MHVPSLLPMPIPSPSQSVWWLGPIPLRAYGILIVLGMFVAIYIGKKRYAQRGGDGELLYDIAMWAIPMGIVGARLYHVITTPDDFFSSWEAMAAIPRIWEGGLAIWGGVSAGALGAWIAVRRAGQRIGPLADSLAPGILVAQAIGRWGNWANQELFGSPTTLPWGLQIDDAHLPPGYESGTLFHPTFLYESLWNVTMAIIIVILDRRLKFRSGQVFTLYLMAYGTGRIIMETMRLDEAHEYLGIRLNAWTSIFAILLACVLFVYFQRREQPTTLTAEEREHAERRAQERKAREEGRQRKAPTAEESDPAGDVEGAEKAADKTDEGVGADEVADGPRG